MTSNPNERRAVDRYLARIPNVAPAGEIVVHNHVKPAHPLGANGFRAWTWDEGDERAVPCACGWAPLLAVHYRVKGMPSGDSEAA